MRDHEHAAIVELARNVVEEAAHPLGAGTPALAGRVRLVHEGRRGSISLTGRPFSSP
jgi:hypothetical protein